MDHPISMCVSHSGTDLAECLQNSRERTKRRVPVGQRATSAIFCDNERPPIRIGLVSDNPNDVRMLEPLARLDLAIKAVQTLGVFQALESIALTIRIISSSHEEDMGLATL
jgi:hypothetical protein